MLRKISTKTQIKHKIMNTELNDTDKKLHISDVIKSVCEDEELQPIECEKHGSCKNCPHYKPVKQTVL
jgi:hypothetical protein